MPNINLVAASLIGPLSMATLSATASEMTISGTPAATAIVGQAYRFEPVVKNADRRRLQFNYYNLPSFSKHYRSCGCIFGTPKNPAVYADIRIGAWDGKHYALMPPFTITVKPAPAVDTEALSIGGTPGASAVLGAYYGFTPTVVAEAGDRLTYAVTNKPAWAQFSTTTGTLAGTPGVGSAAVDGGIVISVSNGRARAALPPFSIDVSPAIGGKVPAGIAYLTWVRPKFNTDGSLFDDLAGYSIRYGQHPTALRQELSVGAASTAALIENLPAGTWYFEIAALNASHVSGVFSAPPSDAIH